MSEHKQQGAKPPVTPGKLSEERKKLWEQSPAETPRPRQMRPQRPTQPPDGPSRPLLAKPKLGFDRDSRNFWRDWDHELPQSPEVKAAIGAKMVDAPPVQQQQPQSPIQPLRRRPPRPRPELQRSEGIRDLDLLLDPLWTELRDDALNKLQIFSDSFAQAKNQRRSVLGDRRLGALRLRLTREADAAIEAADKLLAIRLPAPDDSPRSQGPIRERRGPELVRLQKAIGKPVLEARSKRQAIEDLFADKSGQCPDHLGQALDAKQRGVRFSDLRLALYGDRRLKPELSNENFAAGMVNKVAELVYGDKTPALYETRMFKPEELTTDHPATLINNLGIDRSAPRFGNRNIATKVMADLIGTGVIPDSCFTVHAGRIGLLMEKAPGMQVKDFKQRGEFPALESEDVIASLHGQLNQLEWTDMLTGQGDRHDGNYMIDAKVGSVKISGIDNDFCFGEKQPTYSKYGSSPEEIPDLRVRGRIRKVIGYQSAELPPLIDGNVYDALMARTFDDDVEPLLTSLLADPEIEASKTRFEQMRKHAKSLDDKYVVRNWKEWRSPDDGEPPGVNATEFLKGNKAITLFQRDFGKLVTGGG